jgi:hypothetical protein
VRTLADLRARRAQAKHAPSATDVVEVGAFIAGLVGLEVAKVCDGLAEVGGVRDGHAKFDCHAPQLCGDNTYLTKSNSD